MTTPDSAARPEQIVQRIDWHVIRRLDGLLRGDYRSLFYGQGLDIADLREYQAEDDVRAIDWNVTARMDAPYVRQYVEDREITAWFLLDLSPSMDFGTVEKQKRAVLIEVVATLARLLTRHGNRIGAVLYGRAERMIPARGGRLQVLRVVNDLLAQPTLDRAALTNLTRLVESGLHAIKRRSLVFLVSDFISAPGWERPLRLLSQRHDVIAVRLTDPREIDLPDIGPIVMQDAETGEQLYVDTGDRRFRQRFRELAERRAAAIDEALARAQVSPLALSTDDDLVRALVRFNALRRQRR
ncbi:MAG TPA: DUF58 domain-containing protein [Herpetosiphonaceae bacterium]|nr:DUF58 domain-containing protein [Herpetosiphonaceae bacterium]